MHRQPLFHSILLLANLCFRQVIRGCGILAFLTVLLFPGIGVAQQAPSDPIAKTALPTEKKPAGVMIRMLCVQCLNGEEDKLIFATQTEDGKWIEHGEVTLRSPFITPWIRLPQGTIHLIKKEKEAPISLGSFLLPPKQERAVVVLLPDKSKNIYRARVIEPGKLGFQKGKALIVNYGNVPAMVKLGQTSISVPPGQQAVEKIDADADGMYRMLVAYTDRDKKIVPCYDRFVSSNPRTRKFILLFPDQDSGLRAMSLSEFGPFE